MDDSATNQEAELPASRRELGILLAAAISIEGFAIIVLVWQVLNWSEVSGWGWIAAIVQAGLLLALAACTPLLLRDLLAKISNPPPPGDTGEDEVSNPSL